MLPLSSLDIFSVVFLSLLSLLTALIETILSNVMYNVMNKLRLNIDILSLNSTILKKVEYLYCSNVLYHNSWFKYMWVIFQGLMPSLPQFL